MSSTAEAIDLISSEESATEEEETTATPAIDLTDTLTKDEGDQERSVLETADTAERMVKTYKERQATQKRMKVKNNPWPTPKSRKKNHDKRGGLL
ncbi:Glucosylceramidase [Phytophthora palmivora]|uniref:Glucosylceramidase n=1 Tax=Phytophthora palmivora TaxID=4796 RepID=A0A2P4YJ14_9STRA|nr:Glucosylceramidase [Phytophthora palmivora]